MSDQEDIFALLRTIGSTGKPHFMIVEGEPRSKARPRFSGTGRVYNDKKQRDHEKGLQWAMKVECRKPFRSNVAIACIFYRSTKHRIDLDNLLKQIFDAANNIFWLDDMQVTACCALLRMDVETPRTLIAIGEHHEGLDRGNSFRTTCAQCKKIFIWRKYRSIADRRFCSRTCKWHYGQTVLRAPANCLFCHSPFIRKHLAQKLCSNSCRIEWMVADKKRRAHPKSFCQCCGKPVSRPEYRRCRDCWRDGKKEYAGNGVVYADDRQVVEAHVKRAIGDRDELRVKIWPVA
jgi:Holliday junction resolvase RusA-like endonuclease